MLHPTYLQFHQPKYIAKSVILIIREIYLQIYKEFVFIVPDGESHTILFYLSHDEYNLGMKTKRVNRLAP